MRTASSHIVNLITTVTDRKFEPVARMADAIVDITLEDGSCSQVDLQIAGFPAKEVTALWHFAQSLALIELRHMESKILPFSQKEVLYA